MLLGPGATTYLLRCITSAAADIEVNGSVMVVSTASPPVFDGTNTGPITPASITTATTTTLVAGAASQIKRIDELSLRNNHASTACDVTIDKSADNGSTSATIIKATLLAGEALIYKDGTWLHYDVNGGIYPSVGNAATQAEMEAGTATNKYVTPQGVNWHPGTSKCWVKAGVTANVLASWNVTSLTDNGTGDVTVTIATDFSSVDYCANVSVEMTATTYGVANTREPHIRSGGQAAGTLRCDCVDNTATTSLIKDPTAWHIAMLGDQ